MSPEDAVNGAKSILERHPTNQEFEVLVDNPNDSRQTTIAFRSLGCRVKVKLDGARLLVRRRL